MKARPALLVLLLLVAAARCGEPPRKEVESGWIELEPGLELGLFIAPQAPEIGDGLVRVLRADPRRFALRLLNASAPRYGEALTVRDWCVRHGLVAAINASMYQTDYQTSVSLMRSAEHVNNPHLTRDKAILAFDPQEPQLAPVKIIDLECDSFDAWKGRYGTMIQSIRMLSCRGANVWHTQPGRWSTATIGLDRQGRVLFIHVKSAYTMHDLIDHLVALPLDIESLMYAEGGREAQLHIESPDRAYDFVGGPGVDDGTGALAWRVPNVIGLARRGAE